VLVVALPDFGERGSAACHSSIGNAKVSKHFEGECGDPASASRYTCGPDLWRVDWATVKRSQRSVVKT